MKDKFSPERVKQLTKILSTFFTETEYRSAANQPKSETKSKVYQSFDEIFTALINQIIESYSYKPKERSTQIYYDKTDIVIRSSIEEIRPQLLDELSSIPPSAHHALTFVRSISTNPDYDMETILRGRGENFGGTVLSLYAPSELSQISPLFSQILERIVDIYLYLKDHQFIEQIDLKLTYELNQKVQTGKYAKTTADSILSTILLLVNSYTGTLGEFSLEEIAASKYFREASSMMLRSVNADFGRLMYFPLDGGILKKGDDLVMSPKLRDYIILLNAAAKKNTPETEVCPVGKGYTKSDGQRSTPIQDLAIFLVGEVLNDLDCSVLIKENKPEIKVPHNRVDQ